MRTRQLTGLILASALITLDGTATTIALPAIGRDLSTSVSRLQWIGNAPLIVLAALLLPGGTMADRFGRVRVMRAGLVTFMLGALGSMFAPADFVLIGARFVQGAGAALILPATLAVLRGAYDDASERARIFGVWAAWTGVATAVGPLLAGLLVDTVSWRAVFVMSVAGAAGALALVERSGTATAATQKHPLPLVATTALIVLFGATAYLLMGLAGADVKRAELTVPGALALGAAIPLARDRQRSALFPRELLQAHNCLPANAATFALYFGLFGLSFLLALYTQQVLEYSALRAAVILLPISVMLLLAEPFGRLAARVGTRILLIVGAASAAAGIFWIAQAPHPLAFWSRMIVGTTLYGFGISLSVSAVTHAAVAAAPKSCAGAASGLNHAVVRAAGLVAIALLGSLAAPGVSDSITTEGFTYAMLICSGVVGVVGVAGSLFIRDEEPGGLSTDAQAGPNPEFGGGDRNS